MSTECNLTVMTHHYTNLMINMPVRHTMVKIEDEEEKLEQQIKRFADMDLTNFVILSR